MATRVPASPRPSRIPRTPFATRRTIRLIVIGAIVLVALVLLGASVAYTEQSSFCPTCHEMRPYYTAWQNGPHVTRAQCVDCHVNAGLLAHLAHKPIALKEVWDHFFANSKFPNFTVDIPNARCIRCHARIPELGTTRFSHAQHVNRALCKDCHAQAGHTVTLASLAAEGVLKTTATTPSIAPSGTSPSSISGHIAVICQRCHDQARMKCSQCHQPPHENRGECSNCHQPGTEFVFTHPAGTDCASCHKAPAKHFGPACAGCHTPGVPFAQTKFDHSTTTKACSACHTPPAGHFSGSCSACHKPSVPFAKTVFSHPQTHHNFRTLPCAACHPNGFTTSFCTCHNGHPPTGD